jgi:hypothetical protein
MGWIDRSETRDNPWLALALGAGSLFGTLVAETILASVYMNAPTGRTYARKRSDQTSLSSLQGGGRPHMQAATPTTSPVV